MMCNLETEHVSHFFAFAYSITTFWVEYLISTSILILMTGDINYFAL